MFNLLHNLTTTLGQLPLGETLTRLWLMSQKLKHRESSQMRLAALLR
jgi:hypothetical protein